MKVTCRYTGLTFRSSSFGNIKFVGEHPLVNAPLVTLLSRAGDWSNGELSPSEQHILFVALLKNTDLVEFASPAIPPRAVITSNMERLFKACAWIAFLKNKTYLPKYIVREDNNKLGNIHLWLEQLEDAKTDFYSNYWTVSARNRLTTRETALEKLIKSPSRNEHRFTGILADWALTASGADVRFANDKPLLEYWRSLFRIRGNEIGSVKLVDLEELLEFMEGNLDAYKGGIYAREAIHHLRALVAKKTKGDFFGILDYDTFTFDPDDVLENPFKLLPGDNRIQTTLKTISADAPKEKPRREDFTTSAEYIRAMAQYNIAQRTHQAIKDAVQSVAGNNAGDLSNNAPEKDTPEDGNI